MKYVNTKFMKRMASLRLRTSAERHNSFLLMPISFGSSSLTLLHLLDKRLREKNNRSNQNEYAIHVLFVDMSTLQYTSPEPNHLEQALERFPSHKYSTVRIEDILDYDVRPFENYQEYEELWSSREFSGTNKEKIHSFLSELPSTTSKADVAQILKNRLILQFARAQDITVVLWGDTATKLAEKTLAETAKGRGISIPSQISEGALSLGIASHYPLRDLLRKEVIAFSAFNAVSLTPLIASQSIPEQFHVSARTTLDELMSQYFTPVEETYPNIVANVVNTASKLRVPHLMGTSKEADGS